MDPTRNSEIVAMPRYLIEREFPDGLHIPRTAAGARILVPIIETNAEDGVTWIHSYVTSDGTHTFCVYEGPSPEAIRRAARRNQLPITWIQEVRIVGPYSCR